MAISYVKVRARVITSTLDISTPYVMSFDVNVTRGGVSSCSISLKINGSNTVTVADSVQVLAGPDGDLSSVFIGYVKDAQITPCWDDPSYIILQLRCEDILSRLNGVKFTRREATKLSVWATIDSLTRKARINTYYQFMGEDTEALSDSELYNNNLSVRQPPPEFGSVIGGVPQSGIPIVIEEFSEV